MSFKCPDCGASLTDDSRFCKYCGAKIDDGVKRSEIKIDINKRIEDVADIKRAEYEEKESRARIRSIERGDKRGKGKRITLLILLVLSALMSIPAFAQTSSVALLLIGMASVVLFVFVGGGIIYQLITGKW